MDFFSKHASEISYIIATCILIFMFYRFNLKTRLSLVKYVFSSLLTITTLLAIMFATSKLPY